jgi:hypothetical protein
LKRRSANLVLRRRWTKIMKCFNGPAHVRTINTSRSTINYFVFQSRIPIGNTWPISLCRHSLAQ